jgi:glycosyltransferase involved in cell wall biosynthesis
MTTVHGTRLPSVSVVVPVFNSERTLPELVTRLENALRGVCCGVEVILVNDGSSDRSWDAIQGLAGEHPCVRGINLMRNYGQHNALLCGIRAAAGETVVTIDDDLQHPPEEIPALLARLADGCDVVYGVPDRQRHGILRDLSSSVIKMALQNAMGAETARSVCAFRAFRAGLRDAFSGYHGSFVSIDVLLTWGTRRFAAVTVHHAPRRVGRSNYTVRKLVTHAFNMLTGFSTAPLQLASMVGFVATLFGLCVLAYVLARYFISGASVPGFAFLASTIAIFSGAQLFSLGIIGEYLARMYVRTLEKPPYVVADRSPALSAPRGTSQEDR